MRETERQRDRERSQYRVGHLVRGTYNPASILKSENLVVSKGRMVCSEFSVSVGDKEILSSSQTVISLLIVGKPAAVPNDAGTVELGVSSYQQLYNVY